ncbi:hypothetical protein DL766_010012 [Monosporascus sp. MC13-8B]|nr:hypothetical protein DL763_009734 [Monosporascus cannonballus]RYP11806.1 hypothetical protein DL766_010012 [Monosporascus sp. MC13-8B]
MAPRSADGGLVENDELSTVLKTLGAQNRRIAAQATAFRSSSSETAKNLFQLCDGVCRLTQELISTIEGLKINSAGGKLDRYRQQVDSVLLEVLQDRLKGFTETAEDKNAKIEQNFSQILLSLQPGSQWQRQLIETARQAVQAQAPPSVARLNDFSASLSAGAKHDREKLLKLRMLESLKFAGTRDRYERIPEAHQKTFEWVFHEPACNDDLRGKWVNFAIWLMSSKQLYRVTGKPGSDSTKAFFFMVDGLDELDGGCAELADFLLKTASTGENIKLCLASRPWLVFEDAFRHRPSLRVEDLRVRDIEVFASDKLAEDVMFARLQKHGPINARALIKEVAEKSSGVFLWVSLVVKSLLEGLQDDDTVDDLLARLQLIPRDLEALYQKILGDLDPGYFEQASQIFQTVRASYLPWGEINLEKATSVEYKFTETSEQSHDRRSPLTLLAPSYIEEDPARALWIKYGEPMSWEQQCYNAERMRRRLNSRYFLEDRAHIFLVWGFKSSFDPHVTLCAARLRHAKAVCPKEDLEDTSSMEVFAGLVRQFVIHCHWMERRDKPEYVPFLDEMDRVTETILGAGGQNACQDFDIPHWTKRVDPYVGRTCQVHSLFDYAVIRSLAHYVQAKIADGHSFATNPNKSYLLNFLAQSTALYAGSVEETQAPSPATKSSNESVKEQRKWRHKIRNSLRKRLSSRKS